MKYSLITFRSVTPAQQAEGLLRKEGIVCSLQRTPKWMEQQGCGYSLRVLFNQSQRCAELLKRHEIRYRKVYLLRDNGIVEEITL